MSDSLLPTYKSDFQANGSQVKRAVIHYRPDETMYVEAKSDRVTGIGFEDMDRGLQV